MFVTGSAILYAVLTGFAVLFQLGLAAGLPWGSLAMGGRFPGQFPPAMRLAALVQGGVLTVLALVVLSRAGLLLPEWEVFAGTGIWIAVGISALSALMNCMTPSAGERRLWAPVALLLLASALGTALG
ncbi:hypothetical protein ACE6ED_17845 [Paenibacillus sp. CN-4]|uniref:hypothetical protein n=1 Tax=Paenibacillus nanchangensis TaxID=3348343 RepID=UPI00397B1124